MCNFTHQERAALDMSIARFNESPSLDRLATVAGEVRREVQSTGSQFLFDYRQSELEQAAKAAGIDPKLAAQVIQDAFEKTRLAMQAEIEARPENVAMRVLCSEISRDRTLDGVRSAVYRAVKNGQLHPEQIDRADVMRAMGVDQHPADVKARVRLAEAERAIVQGIAAAMADWSKTDTPETAAMRREPRADKLLEIATGAAHSEARYIDAGVFERLMNVAILEADGVCLLPEIALEMAVQAECEALRNNPSLAGLKASTLRVARRGDAINLEVFERLVSAMAGQPSPRAVVPADTVLAVPMPEAPEVEQCPLPMAVTTYSPEPLPDPARDQVANTPAETRDLMKPEPRKLEPGEGVTIAREPGFAPEFSGDPVPASPAVPLTATRAARVITKADELSVKRKIQSHERVQQNADNLAARRGTGHGRK